MSKNTGILIDTTTGNLDIHVRKNASDMIVQGLQIGDVTRQNMGLIIYSQPGEIKNVPLMGAGIHTMLLSKDRLLYKHEIRKQLTADGYTINYLEITDSNIKIDANYR